MYSYCVLCIRIMFTRGADKSLARSERRQSTATKFRIRSTHSPRSSVHFLLARCYNFFKPLKKIRWFSFQPGLRGSRNLRVGRKMATFKLFFSVQRTGGSLTGPDPEIRLGVQDVWSPGRPISSGLQVPGEPGRCCARTKLPWWPSRGVLTLKCSKIAPAVMSNTSLWSMGPL
jgi:hypothetical protein